MDKQCSWLENIREEVEESHKSLLTASVKPPQTPTETMEFLARSWSLPAMELSKALTNVLLPSPTMDSSPVVITTEPISKKPCQKMVLPKLPMASLPFGGSPPLSPRDGIELQQLYIKTGPKTMGAWLKEHKGRKREEARERSAQIHAATSVAGVAAAVAAIVTAAISSTPPADITSSKSSAAIASAATLVASHCMEMAHAMGADRGRVLAVISSAVNAKTTGDIMALTAGAATALRGASTLRARLQKGNQSFPLPVESKESEICTSAWEFVVRGGDLLKRTRKGVLHWKQVSVCLNTSHQVVIKMKSIHMAGAFVKKKKSVVTGICPEVPAWPDRELEEGHSQKTYFGVKTLERMIEFECKSKNDRDRWVEGIQQMLHCYSNVHVTV